MFCLIFNRSHIAIVNPNGYTRYFYDMDTTDTILTVKEYMHAGNDKLLVRRQRLVYSAGPHGMNALADDETLGGAGVAQDGSAELDLTLVPLTAAEAAEFDQEVFHRSDSCHDNAAFAVQCCGNYALTASFINVPGQRFLIH